MKFALRPILNRAFHVQVHGAHHVLSDGGVILASNHLSFSDSVFLPISLSRRVTFLGKSEYFNQPGLKGWLMNRFMNAIGTLPVDRSGGVSGDASLRAGLEVLQQGEVLGIYPEGTRSPDGNLYRAKSGVARLAWVADVPVVPVAMIGTDKAQPTGQIIPSLHPVEVRFGSPIFARDFFATSAAGDVNSQLDELDRIAARTMADELMRRIQSLSGQTYIDRYAADVKAETAS